MAGAEAKGFIPELSDVAALIWIERHLHDKNLGPELLKRLEALRAKALNGKLSEPEFRELRKQAGGTTRTLRSFLHEMRSIRRQAESVPHLPADVFAALDRVIRSFEDAIASARRVAALKNLRRGTFLRPVRRGRKVSTSRLS